MRTVGAVIRCSPACVRPGGSGVGTAQVERLQRARLDAGAQDGRGHGAPDRRATGRPAPRPGGRAPRPSPPAAAATASPRSASAAGASTCGPSVRGAGGVVGGPVDLAAAGVGDDEQGRPARPTASAAIASSEHTPCTGTPSASPERGGGDHADPQAGERARPDPDDDRVDVAQRDPRVGAGVEHRGHQQLARACGRRARRAAARGSRPRPRCRSTTPAVTAGVAVSRASTSTSARLIGRHQPASDVGQVGEPVQRPRRGADVDRHQLGGRDARCAAPAPCASRRPVRAAARRRRGGRRRRRSAAGSSTPTAAMRGRNASRVRLRARAGRSTTRRASNAVQHTVAAQPVLVPVARPRRRRQHAEAQAPLAQRVAAPAGLRPAWRRPAARTRGTRASAGPGSTGGRPRRRARARGEARVRSSLTGSPARAARRSSERYAASAAAALAGRRGAGRVGVAPPARAAGPSLDQGVSVPPQSKIDGVDHAGHSRAAPWPPARRRGGGAGARAGAGPTAARPRPRPTPRRRRRRPGRCRGRGRPARPPRRPPGRAGRRRRARAAPRHRGSGPVLAGDHERRRRDRSGHPEPAREPPHERRLAGTERARTAPRGRPRASPAASRSPSASVSATSGSSSVGVQRHLRCAHARRRNRLGRAGAAPVPASMRAALSRRKATERLVHRLACCSSIGRWPDTGKPHERGVRRARRRSARSGEYGITRSASPAATSTSQPASAGQGGDPVVAAHGVDEVGERVHGVRADHRVDEVDQPRGHAAVAVGEAAGDRPDEVARARRRPVSTSVGLQPRQQADAAGERVAPREQRARQPGGPTSPADVDTSADPEPPARRTAPGAARPAP